MFRRCAAAALGLTGLFSPAFAAPPLATDDAGVLEPRACELELAAQRSQGQGSEAAQIGCGIGFGSQLNLAAGRARGAGERTLGLAGKTALVEAGDRGIGLAATWAWDLLRTGSAGYHRDAASAALVASGEAGAGLAWHLNLGWSRQRAGRIDSFTWGLAAGWALGASGVELVAEATGDDRGERLLATGLRWSPLDNLMLFAAVSRQPVAPRVRAAAFGLVLGL